MQANTKTASNPLPFRRFDLSDPHWVRREARSQKSASWLAGAERWFYDNPTRTGRFARVDAEVFTNLDWWDDFKRRKHGVHGHVRRHIKTHGPLTCAITRGLWHANTPTNPNLMRITALPLFPSSLIDADGVCVLPPGREDDLANWLAHDLAY